MGVKLCKIDDHSIPSYEILREGWLYKKSSLFDNHSKKWVVLSKYPQSTIFCFKDNKKDPKECSEYFCLADVEFTILEDQGLQFKRKKGGKNTWIFYANDTIEYDRWLKCLNLIDNVNLVNYEVYSNKWTMHIIEE